MAGWSDLTQIQLRVLLRSHSQPADGSKAALVQRLTAFLSDDSEAQGGRGPSASEAAELEAAGASKELDSWRAAISHQSQLTTSLAQQQAQAQAQARAAEQQAKATVKAAAAAARAALHPHRVQHNEQACRLLQFVGQDDLHPTFMRSEVWGVVGLWRLRSVCRAFRLWAQAELSSLPRVVAVGGLVKHPSKLRRLVATSSVESLDLSTMLWSAAGSMPPLPDPRAMHSVSWCADGRVVVCCGVNYGAADQMLHLMSTALQWLPGTGAWSALPDLPTKRVGAASVRLPDGRTMLIGGWSEGQPLASVVVLALDGSGWSDLPPLTVARAYPVAALLPDGKVLVAGGQSDHDVGTALNTAELWDPATQKWRALPPMPHRRAQAAACALPSGRVAVVGGAGTDGMARMDGEVYDPVKREWEPLGAEMVHSHSNISTLAVAGGLIVAGGTTVPELYEEETGRWLTLPHAMIQQCKGVGLVPVPAAALVVR